jgi:outer membrane protein, heavy metal efflux system
MRVHPTTAESSSVTPMGETVGRSRPVCDSLIGPAARRLRLFGCALLLAVPASALGQTVRPDTLHLSLGEVVSRVLAHHPVNAAGAAAVAAAQARAAALRRYDNPTLEVDRTNLTDIDNLRLVQPIRWPGESRALRALGAAGVASEEAGAELARRARALDVSQLFIDGVRQSRTSELTMEAESLAQRVVDRALAARRLDQTGDLTVLQAQVALDAARRERVAADAERESTGAALAVLLGEAPDRRIAFDGNLATLAPLAGTDSLGPLATAGDPESAQLKSEAERASQEASLARARRWPRLELGPAAAIGHQTNLGLALGVGLPLWNRQGDAIRAANADRGAALARLDARHRDLQVQVLQATSSLIRAQRELGLLRGGELTRAAQAADLAARGLQQGGPYLAAWLAARQAYLDARKAELDLEWQAARARLLLHYLMGSLLHQVPP